MKRSIKTIAAVVLATLTAASCQKENFEGTVPAGQEAEVTIDLIAPQIATKAYGDGTTATTVYVHVYQEDASGNLTYIAPAQGSSAATPSQSLTLSGLKATYSTRLVTGQKYTFVFWAQKEDAPYTYDAATKTVTVNYTDASGNDEGRDAFYNVLKGVEITGAYTSSVKLTRPFAQINFGASDYEDAVRAGLTVTDAEVKLTNAATSLNLLDGTTEGEETVTFKKTALPEASLTAGGKEYKYVAMDYVLVGKDAQTLSEVTLTLTATGTQSATPEYTYSNVPLQANYRTNIVGSLFTSPAEVQITVDPEFNETENNVVVANVPSVDAANEAFASGATSVNVTAVSSEENTEIVLPKTADAVSITLPDIPDGKTLTIKYNAESTDGQKPEILNVTATKADAITIEAPTTHVELNGVTVGNVTASTSNTTLVVGKDVTITGTLTIKEGSAVIKGSVNAITKETKAGNVEWYVDEPENLEPALNNADVVVVNADLDLTHTATLRSGKNVTLDMNGKKLFNTNDIWDSSKGNWSLVSVNKGNLTVKGNGVFSAKKDDCFALDVQEENSSITVKNGAFIGNIHAVYVYGGVANIEGGEYSVQQKFTTEGMEDEFVLNCYDANFKDGMSKIFVSGGVFCDFNPGNCKAEGANTNFLKDGYYTEEPEDGDNHLYVVKNLASEVSAIGKNKIVLASDCKSGYLEIPDNADIYLDLNGHRIDFTSALSSGHGSKILGTLSIEGDGYIGDKTHSIVGYLFDMYGNSSLTVTGKATIESGLTCIQLSDNATANVKGGKWIGDEYNGHYWTINKIDRYKDTASVIVTGGEFFKFDPASEKTENPVQNWVAEGYKSVQDGDWYKVVAK